MPHWRQINTNPNSPEVRKLRNDTIRAARRDPVSDRVSYLTSLAQGKRVLDVGVVDHEVDGDISHPWLHGNIAKAASYCLGLDILESEVQTLRSRGFNVRSGDITSDSLDLSETFDLITVGEVIEHLGNPAGLFKTAHRLLNPNGRLVLTTPNPYFRSLVRDDRKGRFRGSVDHVTLLSPSCIAEFAERASLHLDSYRGLKGSRLTRPLPKLSYHLTHLLQGPFASDTHCKTYIFELTRPA